MQAGVQEVTIYKVFAYSTNQEKEVVSTETSTPLAKAFIDALFAADCLDRNTSSISTRQLRAVRAKASSFEITKPMVMPALDVFEDLWQLSHVTIGYVLRAIAAAALMAIALIENSSIGIVVAALFAPFLSPTLAISFGVSQRDWKLARQGGVALLASIGLFVATAYAIGLALRGSVKFEGFHTPALNFFISLMIGLAAGVTTADDTGRRYMVGVAAAVQYAVFPAWIGLSLALGFPDQVVTLERLGSFSINVATIAITSALVYSLIGRRHKNKRPDRT
jgi:uncharacterized membrane protein